VRDLKLVYDLQLDREISARREYELTVESQLRRELASELRAEAADEVAALRAELAALRTNLEILFGTDLEHHRALENLQTVEREAPARSYGDWERNGESAAVDWVTSDRLTAVPPENALERTDESAIIDVSEVGAPTANTGPLLSPRQSAPEPPQSEPQLQPDPQEWQPVAADGLWLPPGAPGSNWSGVDQASTPVDPLTGRRRRARHSSPHDAGDGPSGEAEPPQYSEYSEYSDYGRRSRSRHSTEYGDYGASGVPGTERSEPAPPPRLAPAPRPEPAPRHRSVDAHPEDSDGQGSHTGGQSVAELLARLQVEPTGGGRRRRRDE
jgi:hypothetical protein